MAHKKDAGPPPLEDPNSPDYVCVQCHNKVNSLCLPCLEMALLRTDYVCETCHNKVKSLCHACQEMAQLRANFIRNARDNSDSYAPQPMSDTDRSDSAYDVDIISDSSRSTDTTLDIDFIENVDETGTVLKKGIMKRFQLKSLILDGRFERDSDTETEYCDMPPLEETKKSKADSDESGDEMPPLDDN